MERRQPLLHRIGEAGARVGTKPPRSRRVRLALQIGLAVLIFGFLVLTVIDQWSEIQRGGRPFPRRLADPGDRHPAALLRPQRLRLGPDPALPRLPDRVRPRPGRLGQPLLARYVPGSVLYVLGRVLLSERAGMPRRITIASIVYEQAISATSAIVVAAYFIINHPDLQGQPLRWAVLLLIPAAIVVLHAEGLRAAGQQGAAGLRPRAAAGGDPAARRDRPDRLLLAELDRRRLRHLLRRPLGHLHPLRRHPPGRLGAGDRLLRGAGDDRRPGRPRRPRRRLRLGGEGGAAESAASRSAR